MDTRQFAETIQAAIEAGDFETLAASLTDDFQFSGATPEPLGAQEWLGLSMSLHAAFSDLSYNFQIDSVEGDVVKSTAAISGTHDGDWDLTGMGMGVIPATGIAVSAPREANEAVGEGDKLKSLHIHTGPEGGGIMVILGQLGVEPPAM